MNCIVVLNYNDSKSTIDYITRIRDYESIDKIIVIDNCSTDDSYSILKEYETDDLIVIRTNNNQGYAAGNNFGAQYIADEFGIEGKIIFSNPDITVEDEDVKHILEVLDNDEVFASTGIVKNKYGETNKLFMWKLPSYWNVFFDSSVVLRFILFHCFNFGTRYKNISFDDKECLYADVLPGCFFAVNAKKFFDVGCFDERTFLFFEENILFSKAKKKSYKSLVVIQSEIVHFEGVTRKKAMSWFRGEMIFEKSAEVYLKYYCNSSTIAIMSYKLFFMLTLPVRFLRYRSSLTL